MPSRLVGSLLAGSQPLGVILVVLAFVLSTFCIKPFSAIAGLGTEGEGVIEPSAVVAGVVGAALCMVELPNATAWRVCGRMCPCWVVRMRTCWERLLLPRRRDDTSCSPCTNGIAMTRRAGDGSTHFDDRSHAAPGTGDGQFLAVVAAGTDDDDGNEDTALVPATGPSPSDGDARLDHATTGTSPLGLLVAWLVLAGTAGIGIVITRYFEDVGISNFGYAAVDQVLLPFTTLPVLALACWSPKLALFLGEPTSQSSLLCCVPSEGVRL